MLKKQEKRYRRHKKVRARVFGTAKVPRLCVFRSAQHIYAQLIDDEIGKTLVSANEQELRKKKGQTPKDSALLAKRARPTGQAKIERAKGVGKLIAKKTLEKKIEKVIFDRGGYKYHGRVKALAEGAREGGLIF